MYRGASLRDRLVAVVLLAALPAFGLALYTHRVQRREQARAARDDAWRLARVAAQVHEQRLAELRRLLTVAAALPEARDPAAPGCAARYAALAREVADVADLGIAAASGDVVCTAAPAREPVNVADRPWFDRAVRTQAFAVGDHEVDPSAARARVVAALPVPYPGGGTQAVVFAALDLDWLGRFAAAADLPPGWIVALSDDRGTILARHPDPWRWVGQRLPEASVISAGVAEPGGGTAEVVGTDGVARLFGFAPLPGAPGARRGYVSVAVPRDVALAGADRVLDRALAGLILVTVVALAGAWMLGESLVVRRLRALVSATERLAAGELDARAEVAGTDEIGALARALNAMAVRLGGMVIAEREARHALASRVDALVAERTHEVELLRQLSELLQACATAEEAYAVMGQLCGQLFPDASGTVLVTAPTRDGLAAVAGWGAVSGRRDRFDLDECWALRRGRIHRVDDAAASPACPHLGEPPPAAFLCVPLAAQGETLGLFSLAARSGPAPAGIGEGQARLAITVAEQFALALANLRLRETLRGQSIRDPLTGLFNRRYMEETLERELSRAEREQRALALILLDIDRFKRFNDTYGHVAGDAVLAAIGGLLRGLSRAGDIACRYGGEEFVLILPEAPLPDARRRAEEIREAIRDLAVIHGGVRLEPVRCSIGIAGFPEHGAASETLLRAADVALYRAKREGRDQVVLAD
ncbi:MAG TPA: diguanylate cyclase [Methylomirabilota bacterium]|nr:diguanylate cyclase [Methylomirabilota bacterium]